MAVRSSGAAATRGGPGGGSGAAASPPLGRDALFLALLIAAFVAAFGLACWTKWRFLLYDDIDLAIFTQALANLPGGTLLSSIRGMAWPGDHSSLILFLLAPLWLVAPHPLTLPLLQTLALGLGAIPVFALARRETGQGALALGCAALWLLYPAVGYVDLFEFHPEALSAPCLLAAFHALRSGRTRATAVWAALALLGKEDVALVVGALAIYALATRRPREAAWLAGLAAASLALTFGVLKPAFGGSQAEYGRMYAAWGEGPLGVLRGILGRPTEALRALTGLGVPGALGEATRQYHVHLLLPLAFLPLVAPEVALLAWPVVAAHLLSDRMPQHTIVYQYGALVAPFYVAAAVVGLARLVRLGTRMPPGAALSERLARDASARATGIRLLLTAVLAALLANAMFGPLTGRGLLQARRPIQALRPGPGQVEAARAAERLLARLPREGAVVASFGVLPRVATRREVHALHHVVSGRYTYSSTPYPTPAGIEAVIGDLAHRRLLAYVDPGTAGRMRALLEQNQLRPVAAWGDLVLFARGARTALPLVEGVAPPPGVPRSVAHGALEYLGGEVAPGPVSAGGVVEARTTWRRAGSLMGPTIVQWVVLDPAGRTVGERARFLGYLHAPPRDWAEGVAVRESYRLPVPDAMEPGDYRLALRVGEWRAGRASISETDPLVPVGRFTVAAPER
jgi:uncharacterized membrane protein